MVFLSLQLMAQKKPAIDSLNYKDFPYGDFPKEGRGNPNVPKVRLSPELLSKEKLIVIDDKIYRADDGLLKKYKLADYTFIMSINDETSDSGIKSITIYKTKRKDK